jgi:hypothetical protein
MGISETNFQDAATWDITTTASASADVSYVVLSSTGQRITGMSVTGCYPQKMGSARLSR